MHVDDDRRWPPVLALRGVTKTLRAGIPGCAAALRVLCGVDLELRAGERVVVVGPRGCGKSTLLLVAAGVLQADAGDVWSAPGARLAWYGCGGVVHASRVAERWRDASELLAWPGDPSTGLATGAIPDPWRDGAVRVLRLAGGRLVPCGDRVDSALRAL